MKRLILAMGILFLVACSPSNETIYEDAITVLGADLGERGYVGYTMPDYEMVDIEDNGEGRYKVSGMVENDGYGSPFYVKLVYEGDTIQSYEWYVK